MSRHRIVRNFIDVDSEYYDDEVFGRSVEEDSALSPSLNQFIYNRSGNEEESYDMTRPSVECLQEEQEEENVGQHLNQMSEILDMGFEMDACRDALLQYDGDVNRALNHVLAGRVAGQAAGQVTGEQELVEHVAGVNGIPHPPTEGREDHLVSTEGREDHLVSTEGREDQLVSTEGREDHLVTALHNRLRVEDNSGDSTPTNCRTPVKSNTPRTGSPRASRKPQNDSAGPSATSTPSATPKAKKSRPKDIDVLGILNSKTDDKPLINVAVVGHVDAGKSTLMGHLLCILGVVSQKELHKNKTASQKIGKGSFAFAWVLDETGEERERGVTIDVAQTKFQTKQKTVNLLDAPGHKDFVPNMISGASQADVAILVVDSTLGGFEAGFVQGGQTREHVVLVRALGVQTLIVAVNKMENVAWDKERFDLIVGELGAFFRNVGFKAADTVFVPVSGLEGENLLEKSTTPQLCQWYSGRSLVEEIDALEPPKRSYDKPFRLIVTDVFKHPQLGLSVAGKVDAGYIIVGTPIVVMPGGDTGLVKSITAPDDKSVDYAVAGEQCTLGIGGLDQTKVHNGNVLCESHSRVRTTLKFKARVLVFDIEVPITKGFPVDLHYQTVNEPAVISRLISLHNKSNGQVIKSKPRCLTKNQVALIEVKCERPICLELFKDSKSLGRITCRYGGDTIAAGMVIEIT